MQKRPYAITSKILNLVSQIQSLIGESKHLVVKKPSIKLRKENRIKTIHYSLAIEGNSLTEEQISSLIEGKRVMGPTKQIIEVKNGKVSRMAPPAKQVSNLMSNFFYILKKIKRHWPCSKHVFFITN